MINKERSGLYKILYHMNPCVKSYTKYLKGFLA